MSFKFSLTCKLSFISLVLKNLTITTNTRSWRTFSARSETVNGLVTEPCTDFITSRVWDRINAPAKVDSVGILQEQEREKQLLGLKILVLECGLSTLHYSGSWVAHLRCGSIWSDAAGINRKKRETLECCCCSATFSLFCLSTSCVLCCT